jgi:hypothetical protein
MIPTTPPLTITSALSFEDFCAYAPSRTCIYLPCKTPWPNASIDTRLPPQPLLDASGNPVRDSKGKVKMISASTWLEQNRSVEAFTWSPGEPEFVRDRLAVDGGWVEKPGATTLNTYRPPIIKPGDASKAGRWVDHWRAIYPDDADHIIAWLAQRVQQPGIKVNHALVLGGAPKIGKDTMLEPVVEAVGPWNFREVTPAQLISKNNEFLRAIVVRLSEARDMGEQGRIDRYGMHDHTKNMLVTPPETMRINEKYIREYYIFNRFGMVITTNHRDALFLPANDRRHYLAFSERRTEDFDQDFWKSFWNWYTNEDGINHVMAYLHQYDLSNFDPKAPPLKTPAFWRTVVVERGEEYSELADAIDALGKPNALTIKQLMEKAPSLESLHDHNKRRRINHRLEECHYIPIRNPTADDGLWAINKKRGVIYALDNLSLEQQEAAARTLCGMT